MQNPLKYGFTGKEKVFDSCIRHIRLLNHFCHEYVIIHVTSLFKSLTYLVSNITSVMVVFVIEYLIPLTSKFVEKLKKSG